MRRRLSTFAPTLLAILAAGSAPASARTALPPRTASSPARQSSSSTGRAATDDRAAPGVDVRGAVAALRSDPGVPTRPPTSSPPPRRRPKSRADPQRPRSDRRPAGPARRLGQQAVELPPLGGAGDAAAARSPPAASTRSAPGNTWKRPGVPAPRRDRGRARHRDRLPLRPQALPPQPRLHRRPVRQGLRLRRRRPAAARRKRPRDPRRRDDRREDEQWDRPRPGSPTGRS